jgi:hypothetical protein
MGTLQADSDGRFAIAAINSGENGLPTLYVPSNAPLPWENGNCIVEESTSAATGFGVNALLPFVQHYADHLPLVYAAAFLTADPLTFEDADDFVEFLKNPSHREGGVLNIDRMQAFLEQVYQQGLQDTPYQLLSVQTEVSVVPNEHYAQEIRVQFTAPVSALSIQITNNELAQFEGRTDVSIWLTSPWGSTVPLLNRGEPNHGILRSGYPAFEGARDHTGAGAWELVISSKDSALPMLHVDTNTFAIEVGGYDADSALGQMTHNGIAQQLGVTENTLLIAATDAAKQTATDHNIPSGQPVNRAGADDPLTDTRQQISEDVPYGITVVWAAMDILAKTIGALLPKRKPDRNLIQSAVRQQEKDDHEIGG